MSSSSLSVEALTKVTERLEEYGSSLPDHHLGAVEDLLGTLEGGLNGKLEPAYYLSALDPGVGKTLSVTTFLRCWKDCGFSPASSVLIGLSRLQEIETYVRDAGLAPEDVAVLTSSPEHNALGVPPDQHGTARIMFTTQQMIGRRTRGRKFAEAAEFFYQGEARCLRIWDESLIPAEQQVLQVDELAKLPAALKRQLPELAAELRALLISMWASGDDPTVRIPEALGKALRPTFYQKDQQLSESLEVLSRLAGQDVARIDRGHGDIYLVGTSTPLPDDFAPVVILDASGRVRSTYDVWEATGGPLRRLRVAANDYSRLRVHHWQHQVGKVALNTLGAIEDVAKAVTDVIEGEPTSSWLIVSYKEHPIEPLIRKGLKANLGDRLHFLTWGMHHGTNAYAHCDRVVLIGQQHYGTVGYRALAAACGASPVEPDEGVEQQLTRGEYKHNLLQALTRASVRRSRNGIAGTCTAYVISSRNAQTGDLLPEVFPGCVIETWSPGVTKQGGRAGELIAYLENCLERRIECVPKREIAAALNMKMPNVTRLLGHSSVCAFLERRYIRNERTALVLPHGFDPWPGDGFTIDELDEVV